jgi:uncharacterized protein YndB with AHSA1/START domain
MTEQAPQLTLVRHYRATPERVWAAWTDPGLVVQWFGPDAGPVHDAKMDVREGGRYQVSFSTLDGERHTCLGTYLEVVPHERLAFTWEWITMPERQSQVTLNFRAVDGGTEFTLHHARFADIAARDGHREGWTGALDKLGHLLEGDAA